MENFSQKASMIWSVADILRGGWKQHEYQDVILPLVVLKRLDSILTDTKSKVLDTHNQYHGQLKDTDQILKHASGVAFFNTSPYDFKKLLEDPHNIAKNFKHYLSGYSENIQDIIEKFDFGKQLDRLEGGGLLFLVLQEINKVNLHPSEVDNHTMGVIFEHLLQKFSEMSNETAGEHFTPRDVIELMVEVLLNPDAELLKKPHRIFKIYDPACGTGGMLTVAKDHIHKDINKKADLPAPPACAVHADGQASRQAGVYLYGQELNSVTYAMAKSDMLIKGENPDYIRGGEKNHAKASTLSNDQFFGESYDYGLSNPPYGVDWKKDKEEVEREARRGFAGRFGAGTPRISDGQMLFLQHLVSKMKPVKDGGSRIGIVHNGSPLFTGDAGSGESEIRRWVLEKDLLETIVALPDQLFYNTGINTYLWFLTNRKSDERKGKVQLIDARTFLKKRRKSLGNKRNEIDPESRKRINDIYMAFEEGEYCKIFDTANFGYRQITIERPLRLTLTITDNVIDMAKPDATEKIIPAFRRGTVFGIKSDFRAERSFFMLQALKGTTYTSRNDFTKAFMTEGKKQGFFVEYSDKKKKSIATITSLLFKHFGVKNEHAEIYTENGEKVEDKELRDHENVPLGEDIQAYFEREVKPYMPDAWINESIRDHKDNEVGKVGYEIPFTRYFYKYEAPRELEEIEQDIECVENELLHLLKKL